MHPQNRHYRAMTIKPEYYGLIEMGMTFGIVAIFTVYQLWSLREKPPKDDEPSADPPEA
jgi:hypothetical protein